MALIQIKHRATGATLFEGEYKSLRDCVVAAVKARADLAGESHFGLPGGERSL